MTALTPARATAVLNLVKAIQTDLNLTHWRVEISATSADPGTLFQIVTNRARNHASLRVSEEGLNHPDQKRLLKHEILHLLVDSIREEHDFQLAALQTDRKNEYSERLLREIEKVVEHLSYLL